MPQHIPSVETTTPPPGDYTSWDEYMADVETLEQSWSIADDLRKADYEANHDISLTISKAMRLAPNIAVFNALIAGQDVPLSKLDQHWAKRYRLAA